MLRTRILALGAATFLATLSGCATITNDEQQKLSFSSTPKGADVLINGQEVGTTPVTMNWERQNKDLHVQFKKEGYKTASTTISPGIDPIFWGNIIIGGVVGSTTDAATSKMWEYEPDSYHLKLEPEGKASLEAWRKRKAVLKFTMMAHKQLVRDIQRGEGQYLATLYNHLNVAKPKRSQALNQLRRIEATTTTVPQFATRIVERFWS